MEERWTPKAKNTDEMSLMVQQEMHNLKALKRLSIGAQGMFSDPDLPDLDFETQEDWSNAQDRDSPMRRQAAFGRQPSLSRQESLNPQTSPSRQKSPNKRLSSIHTDRLGRQTSFTRQQPNEPTLDRQPSLHRQLARDLTGELDEFPQNSDVLIHRQASLNRQADRLGMRNDSSVGLTRQASLNGQSVSRQQSITRQASVARQQSLIRQAERQASLNRHHSFTRRSGPPKTQEVDTKRHNKTRSDSAEDSFHDAEAAPPFRSRETSTTRPSLSLRNNRSRHLGLQSSSPRPTIIVDNVDDASLSSSGSLTTSSKTESTSKKSSPDNDDEQDQAVDRLEDMWVPAGMHPELAPSEWQAFVAEKMVEIRNSHEAQQQSRVARQPSRLAHVVAGSEEYMDAAPLLDRRRRASVDSRRRSSIMELSKEFALEDYDFGEVEPSSGHYVTSLTEGLPGGVDSRVWHDQQEELEHDQKDAEVEPRDKKSMDDHPLPAEPVKSHRRSRSTEVASDSTHGGFGGTSSLRRVTSAKAESPPAAPELTSGATSLRRSTHRLHKPDFKRRDDRTPLSDNDSRQPQAQPQTSERVHDASTSASKNHEGASSQSLSRLHGHRNGHHHHHHGHSRHHSQSHHQNQPSHYAQSHQHHDQTHSHSHTRSPQSHPPSHHTVSHSGPVRVRPPLTVSISKATATTAEQPPSPSMATPSANASGMLGYRRKKPLPETPTAEPSAKPVVIAPSVATPDVSAIPKEITPNAKLRAKSQTVDIPVESKDKHAGPRRENMVESSASTSVKGLGLHGFQSDTYSFDRQQVKVAESGHQQPSPRPTQDNRSKAYTTPPHSSTQEFFERSSPDSTPSSTSSSAHISPNEVFKAYDHTKSDAEVAQSDHDVAPSGATLMPEIEVDAKDHKDNKRWRWNKLDTRSPKSGDSTKSKIDSSPKIKDENKKGFAQLFKKRDTKRTSPPKTTSDSSNKHEDASNHSRNRSHEITAAAEHAELPKHSDMPNETVDKTLENATLSSKNGEANASRHTSLIPNDDTATLDTSDATNGGRSSEKVMSRHRHRGHSRSDSRSVNEAFVEEVEEASSEHHEPESGHPEIKLPYDIPAHQVSDRAFVMMYHRFPLHIERAIYRLSHMKLANPKQPLRQQVLLSNFMYAYLNLINFSYQQQQLAQMEEERSNRLQREQQHGNLRHLGESQLELKRIETNNYEKDGMYTSNDVDHSSSSSSSEDEAEEHWKSEHSVNYHHHDRATHKREERVTMKMF